MDYTDFTEDKDEHSLVLSIDLSAYRQIRVSDSINLRSDDEFTDSFRFLKGSISRLFEGLEPHHGKFANFPIVSYQFFNKVTNA